jgi:hypothetical protein
MRLFDPACANSWVWHMLPKNSKPGQPGSYNLTKTNSPKEWEARGWMLICPHQIGWYDDQGFYCTYRPGVEGAFEARYFRVLQGVDADKAMRNYKKETIEERWGAREEVLT